MSAGIVVVTSGFPRRSETFALNELLALDGCGLLAGIFATQPGDGASPHPGSERLLDRVEVLPPGRAEEQAEVLTKRVWGRNVKGIHGYFAHTPTEVALDAAQRLGVPYSFSVHARDARKVSPEKLARRARRAAAVVACNSDVTREVGLRDGRVFVIPHGVDLERFRPRPLPPHEPVRIVAVGRLVEKKGLHVLLDAVARVGVPFHLTIVGDGPERDRLATAIADDSLSGRVTLRGGVTHADLPDVFASAHVVVVPSITDSTGDRDGLPNVILEALASCRPVVASDIGAIRDAITPGETGLLVPAGDVAALAAGIEAVARQPELADRLARQGRRRVEQRYELRRCTEELRCTLELLYA